MNIIALEEHELLKQLTFIKRKRTPPSMILLGIILHFKGLSTRRVKEILALLDTNRHHTSIWRWIRKQGESFKDDMWQGEMPPRIVVDETGLRTSSGLVWVYAAIDPRDRRLLYLDVYSSRDALKKWVFFRRMQEIYGTLPRVAVVDGGRWYIEPLKQLENVWSCAMVCVIVSNDSSKLSNEDSVTLTGSSRTGVGLIALVIGIGS